MTLQENVNKSLMLSKVEQMHDLEVGQENFLLFTLIKNGT